MGVVGILFLGHIFIQILTSINSSTVINQNSWSYLIGPSSACNVVPKDISAKPALFKETKRKIGA